jgi:glycosyltransferase involved in cell wall biosynthesis
VETDVVKVPVREHTLVDLVDAYEEFALLDLSHVDVVITGKYPAWMVQHPFHVVWMLHPLRGLYDTWNPAMHEPAGADDPRTAVRRMPEWAALLERLREGPELVGPFEVIDLVRGLASRLPPGSESPGGPLAVPSTLARAVVHHLDRWALHPSRIANHAAISEQVATRADYFPPDVPVDVVHPPSCMDDPGDTGKPGDVFVTVSRLDRPKRVDLAIAAVRAMDDPSVGLVVVGEGPDRARLEKAARGDARIRFTGRIRDHELSALYRDARAVLVTPAQEDFGYVAIEALQHSRAVVTTTDAGGPTELVTDRVEGIVCRPDAADLRRAVEELWSDPEAAARMGLAARRRAEELDWTSAVDRLLGNHLVPKSGAGSRGRLVAVSTYPVLGRPGGGPERARHLLSSLVEQGWEVTLVALSDRPEAALGPHRGIDGGIEQVEVAPSSRHAEAEATLRRLTDHVSITDVAASVLWASTPELVRELRRALKGATGVIAIQPYLVPAVVELDDRIPIVYDAHNHELALKRQMLPPDEAGRWMLARVSEAEDIAMSRASLVVATTPDDLDDLAAACPGRRLACESEVLPNGVDTERVRMRTDEEHETARTRALFDLAASGETRIALFVGSAHRPNIRAGRAILKLASKLPEVLFVLVGSHTDQLSQDVAPNVRLMGALATEDLDELLRAADVALNPMDTGGGSNLKVMEYFAAGVPVVTTPIGARGLKRPREVALVVDMDGMAGGIQESLAVPNRARVEAARHLVEAEHSWVQLGARFAGAVNGALAADAAATTASREHERPSPQ